MKKRINYTRCAFCDRKIMFRDCRIAILRDDKGLLYKAIICKCNKCGSETHIDYQIAKIGGYRVLQYLLKKNSNQDDDWKQGHILPNKERLSHEPSGIVCGECGGSGVL